MYEILMVVYLVIALALVGFILIQQGKGAGMGSSFGSGASGTVFGASGSGNFLTKTTTILAIIFFGVALSLGNLTTDKTVAEEGNSLFNSETTEQLPETDIPSEALPVSEIPLATEATEGTEEAEVEPKKEDGSN